MLVKVIILFTADHFVAALLMGAGAFWFFFAFVALRDLWAARSLPTWSECVSASAASPRVSVIIAARNEQSRVEQTVLRLLRQQHVDLEIVVVNDRSSDDTGTVVQALIAQDNRVRLITVDTLPELWLGKCHACHLGAQQATGDWLLFTDADIHMTDDLVARAIHTAVRDGAGHLTLYPGMNCHGIVIQGVMLAFGMCLSTYARPAQINADRGKTAMGVGAFNLVRHDAYVTIGGHVPLRMEVLDDVKLGRLLRRAGIRQRVYSGLNEIEAEWAHTPWQAIRALEKNAFAGLDYQLGKCIAAVLCLGGLWILAAAGPFLAWPLGLFALAGLMSLIAPAAIAARRSRWPIFAALLAPFGFVVFLAAVVWSTWRTMRQGGIRWRDTFYPLSELRKGLVR